MGHFHNESFEHFKSIIHPNIRHNIDHYHDSGVIILPLYHGCGLVNRNGARKCIDYKRGHQCVLPTQKAYWKPFSKIKRKDLQTKVYFTRYVSDLGLNYFAKTKGNLWYGWDENKFRPKSDWYKGRDPGIAPV